MIATKTQHTGGPALTNTMQKYTLDELDLRDYFAAKAVQGFASNAGPSDGPAELIAKVAYQWADAMLKARGD